MAKKKTNFSVCMKKELSGLKGKTRQEIKNKFKKAANICGATRLIK